MTAKQRAESLQEVPLSITAFTADRIRETQALDLRGIAAAMAGVMLFLTRVYDIVVDPFIGSWSDCTESRWGRRHPWMLGGAVVAGAGCMLLFNLHEIAFGLDPVVTAGLVMLVYFTGYTAFYIPHMCLASEMTRSYDERTSVMVLRTTLITISGIAVTVGIPALIELWGGRQQSYGRIGFVVGLAVFLSMLVAVLTTPRAAVREYARPEPLRWADIRRVLGNRPFVCLLVAKMIGLLGIGFSGPVLLLFFTEVLGRRRAAAERSARGAARDEPHPGGDRRRGALRHRAVQAAGRGCAALSPVRTIRIARAAGRARMAGHRRPENDA